SYVLKQAVGQERAATVQHEAAVYRLLHAAADGPGLRPYLARLCHHDASSGILILEARPGAQNLRDYYALGGRFSPSLAARLGDALGALHRMPTGARAPTARPPWILSLHRCDLNAFRELSSGSVALVRIVQEQAGLGALLDGLRDAWSARSFIHNDVRWDNCVAAGRSPTARKSRLYLVDWELAGLGDPAWDVGSVLAGYLSLWLMSMSIPPGTAPERLPYLARWPLERMHPALRRFWRSYVLRCGLDASEAAALLGRVVGYAAARLMQMAVEQSQDAVEPTAGAILALQLSQNVLERPGEAAEGLLGLGVPRPSVPAIAGSR
ncbi:MAG TPA: phosphotransferase, partial [Actinoplanes sp.]|nr:phosphotransferase [Actinoplanes sp.]